MNIDLGNIIGAYGPPFARTLTIVIATMVGIRVLLRVLRRVKALPQSVNYVVPKVVWAFALLIVLGTFGVDTTSLMTLMATAGIGLALVFTPMGQNLFAGFLSGMDDTVRDGDVLRVLGRDGRVVRRGPLSTSVDLPDGTRVYIPNVKVIDDELMNHTRAETGNRIDVEIPLDGQPDRKLAVDVMDRALAGLDWPMEGKPRTVLFDRIGSDALHYKCYVWIDNKLDEPMRRSLLLTTLHDALDEAGVSVGETGNISTADFAVTMVRQTAAASSNGDHGSDTEVIVLN